MNSRNVNLSMLNLQDMKVLKVIQLSINKYVQREMTGYLLYARPLTKDYKEENEDDVDAMILSSINETYPESRFIVSRNIFWEGEFEEVVQRYRMGQKLIDFTINLMQSINYEDFHKFNGASFPIYNFIFKLSLNPYYDPLDVACIRNFTTHYIPVLEYQQFEDRYKTFIEIQ
jgi:hypothetical protein